MESEDAVHVSNSAPRRPEPSGSPDQMMRRIDALLSHVWMVRTFLKHSDEAAEDEELREVHRELYDYMLALGPSFASGEAAEYLALARKKFAKLKRTTEQFIAIQPEVSDHTNFRMAARSLATAIEDLEQCLR